jgi:class 3 adenylate cyclase/predicted ATPase
MLLLLLRTDAGAKAPPSDAATASGAPTVFPEDRAERRQVTVLFSDLVGSTALSARMDPEDLREVISAYHKCVAEAVRRFGGFVAQYLGDGVLVYFGYPEAHEDDAERAVRAGLELIAAVIALKTSASLQTRVGIATGLVVVGDLMTGSGEARERGIVGETPNLAARLQGIAEPNTVAIGEGTRRLLGNLFELKDLGARDVKGVAEPVRAWVALRASTVESRFEALHPSGLTALVGREEETELLLRRWSRAKSGEGQVVLISGEAGIGKSRLAAALAERIAGEPHTRLRHQCSPYHTNSALHPFIAQLERAAGFKADDTSEQRLDKLEAVLAIGSPRVQTVAPLFAALLSIPFGVRYLPLALSPAQQRRQTLAALLDQFEGLASQQPILLLFEDLHWADASSLELLNLTLERVRHLRVLALFTFRPEFEPPWIGLPNVGTLSLGRLDRNGIESIVAQVTGGRALPAEVMKQIVAKTDGNPLFVEELTKTVLEAGILVEDAEGYRLDGPLPALAVPETLQDSLMARLDRLARVREIAQIGAAIGRDFSYSLLRAVVGRDETALKHALAQLEQAELVFRRGEPPEVLYSFKHALVRDAAYESLLKSRRQQLHGQIARTLEQGFAHVVASQPEIAAHHFTEAGLVEAAIDYWLKAGQHAARSANAEALHHLARGLELLPNIDDPMLRNKSELLLQTSLGNSLWAIKGWSIDSVKHAYTRALQLCRESGFDEHTVPAVFGLWTWNFRRAALKEAQALAEHLVNIAENTDDSVYKVLAHEALGFTLFAHGKFAAAHASLERSINLCEDSKASTYLDLSAQDPRVHVRSYDGMVLWFLGYPDQALRICAEARRYAHTSQHPFSEATARTINLRVHQFRGEAAVVAHQANEAIALCEQHEFVHYLAMALILRGWASTQQGEFEKGIAEMQAGLEKERATGALIYESYTLGLLAGACIKNGCYGQALDFLNDAQARIDDGNSERFYAAEIYRLLGEAYLRSGQNMDQAKHYFYKSLKIAREQKAKSLELRVCLSICDLYDTTEHADKHRSELGDIYGSFSEGFDTADLVRAKAMLDLN